MLYFGTEDMQPELYDPEDRDFDGFEKFLLLKKILAIVKILSLMS